MGIRLYHLKLWHGMSGYIWDFTIDTSIYTVRAAYKPILLGLHGSANMSGWKIPKVNRCFNGKIIHTWNKVYSTQCLIASRGYVCPIPLSIRCPQYAKIPKINRSNTVLHQSFKGDNPLILLLNPPNTKN